MTEILQHLKNAWEVDQAILREEEHVVLIRFGYDWEPSCIEMDAILQKISLEVSNMCKIYLVDIREVPDFNLMYDLIDPFSLMFFYRNKHIMVDVGTGDNNRINFKISEPEDLIDIIETVYIGARKSKGLVLAPKSFSATSKF
eukprot:TRINITY_DN13855_c0_g1_i1.p1 TRINITY_DN13855_c0_g1~~TRINITY_DN13855_c0_g1_i1.p1  ORF type:complete len:156 (+),score=34.22 TRINITY_DN13855_c0_g1_i1:41-469(+)